MCFAAKHFKFGRLITMDFVYNGLRLQWPIERMPGCWQEQSNRLSLKVRALSKRNELGRAASSEEAHHESVVIVSGSFEITFELFCSIRTINFQSLLSLISLINPRSFEILDFYCTEQSLAKNFAN